MRAIRTMLPLRGRRQIIAENSYFPHAGCIDIIRPAKNLNRITYFRVIMQKGARNVLFMKL